MGVFYMFEFLKRKKTNRSKYQVDSENLAVPEVHIGNTAEEDDREHTDIKDREHADSNKPITVDTEDVAVPEIHIRKK